MFALILVATAIAADSGAEFPRGSPPFEYRNWADFGLGSTVTFSIESVSHSRKPDVPDSVSHFRQTLTSVEGRAGRRELRVDILKFMPDGNWSDATATVPLVAGHVSLNIKDSTFSQRTENLTIGDRPVPCTVYERVRSIADERYVITSTMWMSDQVPGRLVKQEEVVTFDKALVSRSVIEVKSFEAKK